VALVVALGIAWYSSRWRLAPQKADSTLFQLPSVVPDAPSSARASSATGANPNYQEGQRLLRAGDANGAVLAFRKAIESSPSSTLYRIRLADALRAAGSVEEARAEYEAVLRTSPESIDANRELGTLLSRSAMPSAALPHLRKAVAGKPDDLEIVQEIGYVQERTGDKDGAVATYREVIDKFPESDVARGRLAGMLIQAGKTDDAITVLGQGLARTPNVPHLHRELGFALEHTDRSKDAADSYRAYLRLAPNALDAAEVARRADLLEKKAAAGTPPS
jgi:Flp pilus assembly protein TadD